ncbi:DUF6355 family natural product biosynthesis protein [Streptomyces hainanensis]|uniref:Secreted protein n=1 Tax=Streptomyces hainanensis TaxID=402648 RepID=A0A4R4TIC2_9ACTN|nr:DUF6355 family natural product biosynthesis protein [Streptomyces hainanensis]TDC77558.1 hypothetical protein E1283_07040 [Streptomyces hainanensis]
MRYAVRSLLVTAAVAACTLPITPTSAAAQACGYWQTSADAYYTHCDNGSGSRVIINVDTVWASDYEKCVGPGDTHLGSTSDVRGAWYVGRTC